MSNQLNSRQTLCSILRKSLRVIDNYRTKSSAYVNEKLDTHDNKHKNFDERPHRRGRFFMVTVLCAADQSEAL